MADTEQIRVEVRGNLYLRDDDARLFIKLTNHLNAQRTQVLTIAEVLRDAVRCYAKEQNITL